MPKSPSFFITATGTDQGKTAFTAALCWQLRQQGREVAALKPVVSGEPEDTRLLLRALELPGTEENIVALSPWRFAAPLSPDEAARREGRKLEVEEIRDFCLHETPSRASVRREAAGGALAWGQGPQHEKITLIEGAGGVMSPLSETATNLDLMAALGCPTILVSATPLGCISQILTALTALRSRKISVAGLVLMQVSPQMQPPDLALRSLQPHLPAGLAVIGVNHLASGGEIWKIMPDVTRLVSMP